MIICKDLFLARKIQYYRASWSVKRLLQWLQPGDRILDLGAGDCYLGQLLINQYRFDVTNLEVEDYNFTDLPLTLYNGTDIPFPDNSFDVVLMLFVLHHTSNPGRILSEARRVCRRSIIVFEDLFDNPIDRIYFRFFHSFLNKCTGLTNPCHEYSSKQWSHLAEKVGLIEVNRNYLGRQISGVSSRHIAYLWNKPVFEAG
ncbi:MAG: class I SAM-dependent methyltransferase [Firmicutes bacterium]|nr:class I SAM-dependent methyltransferase [Bacillota bacterium]